MSGVFRGMNASNISCVAMRDHGDIHYLGRKFQEIGVFFVAVVIAVGKTLCAE